MACRNAFNNLEADELTPMTTMNLITSIAKSSEPRVIIIKFSADWCKPCKDIKQFVEECVNELPKDDIVYYEVDIDKTLELYLNLKNKRMLKGVPTIIAWYPKRDRDENLWYIPDDSVSGGNRTEVGAFFMRCATEARKHIALYGK